tara:strand:- start:23 stop:382 length:360 start_codon:yes stop_codon:yes gene_type:complete
VSKVRFAQAIPDGHILLLFFLVLPAITYFFFGGVCVYPFFFKDKCSFNVLATLLTPDLLYILCCLNFFTIIYLLLPHLAYTELFICLLDGNPNFSGFAFFDIAVPAGFNTFFISFYLLF